MAIYRGVVRVSHPNMPDPGYNTWHFSDGGVVSPSTMAVAISQFLETFYTAVVGPGIAPSAAVTHEGIWSDVLSGTEVQVPSWTKGTGTTGPTLPPANAVVISWRTGTTQRSGVGRTFLGPVLGTQASDDGTPSNTAVLAIRTAAATLITSNRNGFPDAPGLGVFSRQNGTLRQLQTARVRDRFAVLRSRRD